MTIVMNGQSIDLPANSTLQNALEQFKPQAPFALMLNQNFIPKSQYGECLLKDGDQIEIVGAIQGG